MVNDTETIFPKEIEILIQKEIDSLMKVSDRHRDTIYPFNPNFISDYKGYQLGMSLEEIDRLFAYRSQNQFVNSSSEFQEVTKISDSLLEILTPYFKFPSWVTKKTQTKSEEKTVANLEIKDLNRATAQSLQAIKGIGKVLSKRIIEYRDKLNGFVDERQLYDVYGLRPEVVKKTIARFKIITKQKIKQQDINTISLYDIAKLPYINYDIAEQIVAYRSEAGEIKSIHEIEPFLKDTLHATFLGYYLYTE